MQDGKKNRFYWTIIVLLVIIILILLYFVHIVRVVDNGLKPTGNVDVFDIDINCSCKDKSKCSDKDGNIDIHVVPDDLPVYDEEEDIDVIGTVFVDDKNGNYIYQQNLKIFTNSAFEQEDLIAPGVSNTYNFVVHNSSNIDLLYNLYLYDTSEYKINMKFRLRRNNEYIVGSKSKWASLDELNLSKLFIESGSSDSYSLDWKWVYSGGKDKEDTNIGKNMTTKYKLNIRFDFAQA